MKVTFWVNDEDVRTFDVTGPLRVVEHPGGMMDILHDEASGVDYWFNKDGSLDGTGISAAHAETLTGEEAKEVLKGLREMHEGKTKPFKQIQEEVKSQKLPN